MSRPGTAKAAEELAGLRLLREVIKASEAGMSEAEIAVALQVAQPVVHRVLRKANRDPSGLQRTTREVALEYAAGEITHEAMLSELSARDYTYGHVLEPHSPVSDAHVRGTWDEAVGAAYSRLITSGDVGEIAARVERRCAAAGAIERHKPVPGARGAP
jgi:hypothetical protein